MMSGTPGLVQGIDYKCLRKVLLSYSELGRNPPLAHIAHDLHSCFVEILQSEPHDAKRGIL